MWVPRGLGIRRPRAHELRIRPYWGTTCHVISPSSPSIRHLIVDNPLISYRQVYLNGSVNLNFYPLQYIYIYNLSYMFMDILLCLNLFCLIIKPKFVFDLDLFVSMNKLFLELSSSGS